MGAILFQTLWNDSSEHLLCPPKPTHRRPGNLSRLKTQFLSLRSLSSDWKKVMHRKYQLNLFFPLNLN